MKRILSIFGLFLVLSVSLKAYDIFEKELIYFPSDKEVGSIVIKTNEKKLYYLAEVDLAYEFSIAVGKHKKDRFYGTFPISRKAKWPEWRPTESMLEKEPNLPEVVKGGKRNPLGARALYLGDSAFRIHGTNNPRSIGKAASHGCIRMHNEDVKELYKLVYIGNNVYVER